MAVSQQIIKTTLKQGAVYLMRHRTLTSPKKHFVVVMNEHPCGEVIILFNVVTSKIDTVKKLLQKSGAPHYTAVELSPKADLPRRRACFGARPETAASQGFYLIHPSLPRLEPLKTTTVPSLHILNV